MTKYETRLFINGEFVEPATAASFPLTNPATEEFVADVHIAGLDDVNRAVAAAQAAQPAWAGLPGHVRAAALNKLADLIELPENAAQLKECDAVAMGRPVGVQWLDVMVSAGKLRYDASLAHSLVGESSLLSSGQLNLVLRQPYGVTAGILPFNVPTIMWVSKVGASVAAGNAIIIKSSEKSPLGALFLASLTKEAGFPPGIIQVVSGLGPVGKYLSEHMDIRKISFTGSTRTGRMIATAAAQSNLKAVALELGGKSPTVIFEDADLAAAVPATSFSVQWNSGQICMANSRIYVHETIADKFIELFKKEFSTYVHGDPLDGKTTLGPQADDIQGKAVLGFIDIGKKDGKLEVGGERVGDKGYFITPTVFTSIPDESKLNTDEVFGPVVVIHTFKDEAEALRRANASEFGLYASVFTKDIDRAIRVAKALEAGTVSVNTASPAGASEIPFGGFKSSGLGREGGTDSLKRWTEEKSVVIKYNL